LLPYVAPKVAVPLFLLLTLLPTSVVRLENHQTQDGKSLSDTQIAETKSAVAVKESVAMALRKFSLFRVDMLRPRKT